ncbi:unnamed protein product, partial [Mesorhabditis spiculigera]
MKKRGNRRDKAEFTGPNAEPVRERKRPAEAALITPEPVIEQKRIKKQRIAHFKDEAASEAPVPLKPHKKVYDRFRELDEQAEREIEEERREYDGYKPRKREYEQAMDEYERIQADRAEERLQKQQERAQRREALEKYNTSKRKMNKALKMKNKKGQPNLNAQVSVLLERIQKKMKE